MQKFNRITKIIVARTSSDLLKKLTKIAKPSP